MYVGPLIIVGIIVLIHSVVALTATIAILRDSSLDSIQLIGKLLICWVLIFIGPVMILKLISEYSPEILPKIAKSGPLAYLLFARLNPDFHNYKPAVIDEDLPDMSGSWDNDIDGSCGGAGD